MANCIQATGSTNAQRRTWLADTLNEADLGWSTDIWNNLGMTGWPCLKKISDAFGAQDGCPPMAPFICPGGTVTVGDSVTGSISCQSCTTALGYKLVGSQCVRFEGDFSRIGTADKFGVGEDFPQGLASIGDTLYMVGSKNNALYTLDTATGIATRVGSATEFGVVDGEDFPRGLASITITENGTTTTTLYMVGDENNFLYTLNTDTGVATKVGSGSTADAFGAMEGLPEGLASITITENGTTTTTLYMVGNNNDALYTLNTDTGVATKVASGSTKAFFGAMEGQPEGLASIGNILYMVGNNNEALYTLDTSSGVATRVGATRNFGVGEDTPRGLASIGDTLYMVGDANDALYKAVVE